MFGLRFCDRPTVHPSSLPNFSQNLTIRDSVVNDSTNSPGPVFQVGGGR